MNERLAVIWEMTKNKIPPEDKKKIPLGGVEVGKIPGSALAHTCLGYIELDPVKLEPLSDAAIMAVMAHELGHLYYDFTNPFSDESCDQKERIAYDQARRWGFDVETFFKEIGGES
jgi:hypothetical protein